MQMNKKGIFLHFGLILAVLFVGTSSVYAANHYIRSGATGANNGSDWTNAYTSMPATLIRGDTYYIADGSYGGYTFDDPDSGSNFIFIKKAISNDHGTDTGWSPTYGDGTAEFTYWNFDGNYYDVDGQVGQWADFLLNNAAYGIKVIRTATGDNQSAVRIGGSGNPHSYITLRHIEISNGNNPRTGAWYKGQHGVFGYGNYWTLRYCWIHDVGSLPLFTVGGDFGTVDHCALGRNGHSQVAMNFSPSEHSEIVMLQPDADDWTFQYSYFYDWRSTGNWVLYGGNDRTVFKGNIVFTTGYWSVTSESGDSDGVLQACMHGDIHGACTDTKVVNNTFVNIPYGGRIASMTLGSVSGLQIENNIFYNVKVNSTGNMEIINNSYRQYNWYGGSGVSSISSETGKQNGSGDPFVNSANYDFRLSSDTNPGITWGSPYTIDGYGNSRGSDGIWDRGAFDFTNDNPPPLISYPSPPGNLQVN